LSKTVLERNYKYVAIKTVRYVGDYRQWVYTARTQELATAHMSCIFYGHI